MREEQKNTDHNSNQNGRRPHIAFFDYPDVFEDFYTHYGVTQEAFARSWHNTANHAWLKIVQEEIGDVTWFVACIKPQLKESSHDYTGCKMKFFSSSWSHRQLWRLFYKPRSAWRWKKYYRSYATIASYLSLLSFSFFQTLKKNKPDIIFVQDYCSGRFDILVFFARILKIPILTFHSGSTPEKYLGKFFKNYTIPKADWIFSSGGRESTLLQSKFKIPVTRLSIIRPAIDTSIYKPLPREEACSFMQLDAAKRYWVFTGRLDDDVKRISSIFEKFQLIAKDFPTIDLLVVGTGKDEQKLKRKANELAEGRIHFLGWVAEDAKKAWIYNAAECLFLASWREASPAVIGEAFSCGTPVATSKVGGIDDLVIPDKSGWLFPAGNDEAMYHCFSDIATNPATLIAMRPIVRSIAEEMVSFKAMTLVLKKGFSTVTHQDVNE
jgi:glycosyltransferase involved in cell wall biosynthesis